MTPQEMLTRRALAVAKIGAIKLEIRLDLENTRLCKPPRNLRRARESDIVHGAIIWTGVRNKPMRQQWAIVECVMPADERVGHQLSRGHGFVYQAEFYATKNCWIEKCARATLSSLFTRLQEPL